MDQTDLQQQLAKAKLAMTDGSHSYSQALAKVRQEQLKPKTELADLANDPVALEKKRIEARRFMESPEQRQRRLDREQAEAQKKLTEKRVEELKEARLALEKKRQTEANDFIIQAQKAREEVQKKYEQNLVQAKEKISTIISNNSTGPQNIRTLKNDLFQEVTKPDFSVTKTLIEQRQNQKITEKTSGKKIVFG